MAAVLPEEEEFKMITEFGFTNVDLNQSEIKNPQSEIKDKVSKVSNQYTQWQDIQAQKQE